MNLDDCLNRIDKYLESKNARPLLINVQNGDDLDIIITRFDVDGNVIVRASKFCNKDEMPRMEMLLQEISETNRNYFLTGLSSFLRFYGEAETKQNLQSIANLPISGHVVIITYQCENLLNFHDPRTKNNILFVDGEKAALPDLIFSPKEYMTLNANSVINGIENVPEKIENSSENIFVITKKHKSMFPNSVYQILDRSNPYDLVVERDAFLQTAEEKFGDQNQWGYLLKIMDSGKSFAEICDSEFGNHQSLEIAISNFKEYSEDKKWLYFIALKTFGSKNNACLNLAAKNAESYTRLVREVFRGILVKSPTERDFAQFYAQRKSLLRYLGNPPDEVDDFCKIVRHKEQWAIYYLTDNTTREKELVLLLLEKHYQSASKGEIEKILSVVYPDLCAYIKDYRYNDPLLDKYFSLYTLSKVTNRVLPELEELVIEQARRREYNLLEPRDAKIDLLDKVKSQLYFVDSMGVEYLSFILSKCGEKGLMADVSICCAKLPSITSVNKGFVSAFKSKSIPVKEVISLDEIKHDGIRDNFMQRERPVHIVRELEIIEKALDEAKNTLSGGNCEKVIMASDHGASRLAVIHETETMWEMAEKGKHSGRCCPKNDADVKSEFATEENGFWILANYDRFKGSRKANVEVHGGATLEEVVVPVIVITNADKNIEVSVIDKVIKVSYRKKASIRLFINTKSQNVTVRVNDKYYEAMRQEDNIYVVEMLDLKKAQKYNMDVYSQNNLIASGLDFEIKKEASQENDLL